jgi:prolyl 4-hydroxylase
MTDAHAFYQQACRTLAGAGVPRDLPRGRALLHEAAQAGQWAARHIEIALMGNGSGAPPDWAGALALLRDFAKTDPLAAEQIALIDCMALAPDGAPAALPEPERLSAAPVTRLFRGLFTPEECLHVGRLAQNLLQPAGIIDQKTGRRIDHPHRDSDAATLGPPQEDLVVQALLRRIAAACGTRVTQGEPLNVLRYQPGQQYRPHLDVLPPPANQRVLTALAYLNDGYEGGETQFDRVGLDVKGRAGDVLIFANVGHDGRPDPLARHASLPVRDGVKWVATRWIRERDYDAWNPA